MPWSVGSAERTARIPHQDRLRLGAGISRIFALRAGKCLSGGVADYECPDIALRHRAIQLRLLVGGVAAMAASHIFPILGCQQWTCH